MTKRRRRKEGGGQEPQRPAGEGFRRWHYLLLRYERRWAQSRTDVPANHQLWYRRCEESNHVKHAGNIQSRPYILRAMCCRFWRQIWGFSVCWRFPGDFVLSEETLVSSVSGRFKNSATFSGYAHFGRPDLSTTTYCKWPRDLAFDDFVSIGSIPKVGRTGTRVRLVFIFGGIYGPGACLQPRGSRSLNNSRSRRFVDQ